MSSSRIIWQFIFSFILVTHQAQNLSFTVTSSTGFYTLTCSSPSLQVSAYSTHSSPVSYTWTGPNTNFTGPAVVLNTPGIYSVVASDGNIISSQTLAVSINTIAPSGTVSPAIQQSSCKTPIVPVTLLVLNPNIDQTILSPHGGTLSLNTNTFMPLTPGNFTYVVTDTTNGCRAAVGFTVLSIGSYPTMSVTSSPMQFTLGCGSASIITVSLHGMTDPPGNPMSYTLLPPTASIINYSLSSQTSFTVISAGNHTAIVRDDSSFCVTKIPISILKDTVPPVIQSLVIPTHTITCHTPSSLVQVLASIKGSTFNISYDWSFAQGTSNSNTLSFWNYNLPDSLYAENTYSLRITSTISQCYRDTTFIFYKNMYKPNAQYSVNGINQLCVTQGDLIVNQSSTGIPSQSPFNADSAVVPIWIFSGSGHSVTGQSFTATEPLTFTLQAIDKNNGCSSQITSKNCTGIGSINAQMEPVLFPNPAKALTNIKCGSNCLITLYSSTGVLIPIRYDKENEVNILNLQNLSSGVYTVKINCGTQSYYHKLLKIE